VTSTRTLFAHLRLEFAPLLTVDERRAGKEKLVAKWKAGPQLVAADFGDPSSGTTAYAMCVYGDSGALVGEYKIDRAGASCRGKPCWKVLGGTAAAKGYRYNDRDLTAYGIRSVSLKAREAGRSSVVVKGRGGTGLPLGVATALAESTAGATIQLFGTDLPECFSVTASLLTKTGVSSFKAEAP
jgi:hypothetical protein